MEGCNKSARTVGGFCKAVSVPPGRPLAGPTWLPFQATAAMLTEGWLACWRAARGRAQVQQEGLQQDGPRCGEYVLRSWPARGLPGRGLLLLPGGLRRRLLRCPATALLLRLRPAIIHPPTAWHTAAPLAAAAPGSRAASSGRRLLPLSAQQSKLVVTHACRLSSLSQGMMLECGAYLHTQQLGGMGRGHWQPPPHDYRHGPLWRPAGRGGYPMLLKSDDDMAAAATGHHSASSSSSSRHRGYAGVSGGGGALPIWDLPVKAEGGSPPRGGLMCSGSEVVSDADETQGPATQEPDQQGSDQEEGGRLDGETAIGDGDEDWIGQDVLEALQQGGGP